MCISWPAVFDCDNDRLCVQSPAHTSCCQVTCFLCAVVTIAALAQCGGLITRNGCRGPTCPGGCALQQCRVCVVPLSLHCALKRLSWNNFKAGSRAGWGPSCCMPCRTAEAGWARYSCVSTQYEPPSMFGLMCLSLHVCGPMPLRPLVERGLGELVSPPSFMALCPDVQDKPWPNTVCERGTKCYRGE